MSDRYKGYRIKPSGVTHDGHDVDGSWVDLEEREARS